jgi:hypothetical protein
MDAEDSEQILTLPIPIDAGKIPIWRIFLGITRLGRAGHRRQPGRVHDERAAGGRRGLEIALKHHVDAVDPVLGEDFHRLADGFPVQGRLPFGDPDDEPVVIELGHDVLPGLVRGVRMRQEWVRRNFGEPGVAAHLRYCEIAVTEGYGWSEAIAYIRERAPVLPDAPRDPPPSIWDVMNLIDG